MNTNRKKSNTVIRYWRILPYFIYYYRFRYRNRK